MGGPGSPGDVRRLKWPNGQAALFHDLPLCYDSLASEAEGFNGDPFRDSRLPVGRVSIETRPESDVLFPADPGRGWKTIARAREHFVASGEIVGQAPRAVIVDSWQRCRERGVDPLMERAPTVVDPAEIELILGRRDLGQAGRAVLDEFSRAVEGTNHVILLADANGRIVYSAGHRAIQGVLDRLNLAPGGGWSETDVGSNGVGTPIALGRPEAIFGPEHYCQQWQPWVCYGCPVRHPSTGQIVGGVDVTGPAKKADPMAFALTVSIARSIEQRLVVRALQRRHELLMTFRGLERRWPNDGLLVIDEGGKILEMNPAAASALGVHSTSIPDPPLSELSPELWIPVRSTVETGSSNEARVVVRRPLGGEKAVLCRVDPVSREGRTVGSIVILSEGGTPPGRRAGHPVAGLPRYVFAGILGKSPGFREALGLARAAARSPHQRPILLVGESGTGKELVAHAIHAESRRAQGRFVAVNCGALPAELVESELFGYAPGAFTGARREGQAGKFEAAHGGTIFLDEIDSLP